VGTTGAKETIACQHGSPSQLMTKPCAGNPTNIHQASKHRHLHPFEVLMLNHALNKPLKSNLSTRENLLLKVTKKLSFIHDEIFMSFVAP